MPPKRKKGGPPAARRAQALPATSPGRQAAPRFSASVTFKDRPEVVPLIEELERLRGSRIITYFLDQGAAIAFDAVPSFYRQLREIGRQEHIDLWIQSQGGTTEVPWRIVQMIRPYCNKFGVLVTEVAQSAATHLALGADEIVMGAFSVLSPVDPQRMHPLLPTDKDDNPLRISVQDLKHAVAFIKREAGGDGISGEAYAQVIAALFDKVHPLALGAIEQSYALTKLITKRMLATHMDEDADGEAIEKLADALCDDYMSHQFPIGLLEARRLRKLGLKLVEAPDPVYDQMWKVLDYYNEIDRSPSPLPPGTQITGSPPGTAARVRPIGHIDSTAARIDCLAIAQSPGGAGHSDAGAIWVPIGP